MEEKINYTVQVPQTPLTSMMGMISNQRMRGGEAENIPSRTHLSSAWLSNGCEKSGRSLLVITGFSRKRFFLFFSHSVLSDFLHN